MDKPVALIIDDEASICESLAGVLEDEGWSSALANSGEAGLLKFKKHSPDIVFVDVWMKQMDGIETLQKLKQIKKSTPVVIMSGHGTIETAVKATKGGAFDFLEKPLSIDQIVPMLRHALNLKKAHSTKAPRDRAILVGSSPCMTALKEQVEIVGRRNSWVLITGENGTGKEVVANLIHHNSARADKAFVPVNCAAIPDELIESELFGHVKGAFTGAISNKSGRFEMADRGTLFLDEIGDMSIKTQAKILRILEHQQFEKIGSTKTVSVDVRLVAATNKDLGQAIKAGEFREDLYHRLNVIPIYVPPLRERLSDLPQLLEFFSAHCAASFGDAKKVFEEDSVSRLSSYSWPGNVRELKNFVERLYILEPEVQRITEREIQSHLNKEGASPKTIGQAKKNLKVAKGEFEKDFIVKSLELNNWNISKTADAIGVERSNLHRKLRMYNIEMKSLKDTNDG